MSEITRASRRPLHWLRMARSLALVFMGVTVIASTQLSARRHACLVSNWSTGCQEDPPWPNCGDVCEYSYGMVPETHDCYRHTRGEQTTNSVLICEDGKIDIHISCDCKSPDEM